MRRFHFDWAKVTKHASGKMPPEDEAMTRKCASMIRDYWAGHRAFPEVLVVFKPGRTEREKGVWTITSDMANGLPKEFQS